MTRESNNAIVKYSNLTGNSYSQAIELTRFNRLVFVSGQVPEDENKSIPTDFANQ